MPEMLRRQPRRRLTLWEMLVWAYRDQMVGGDDARGLSALEMALTAGHEPRGSSSDGIAKIERIAAVGTEIDGGLYANLSDRMHPDAIRLNQLVLARRVAGERGALNVARFIMMARKGEQPEPSLARPLPYPTNPRSIDSEVNGDKVKTERAEILGQRVDYAIVTAGKYAVSEPILERRGKKVRIVGQKFSHLEAVPCCPLMWEPSLEFIDWVNGEARGFVMAMWLLHRAVQDIAFRDHIIEGIGLDDGLAEIPPPIVRAARPAPRHADVESVEAPAGASYDSRAQVWKFRTVHARARVKGAFD